MKIGDVRGEWTVISRAASRRRPSGGMIAHWICECSCGVRKVVEEPSLVYGRSKRCGHLRRRRGEHNPGWKGGRYKSADGYIVVQGTKIDGVRFGRSLEHQNVMEKFLGRPLRRGETVHHKNGVRDDNDIRNLELWVSGHPGGQRLGDLIDWAVKLLREHAPEVLK